MKISTKGIYALEMVTDLAMHSTDTELESLRNIAERRGLSEKYLERIAKVLKDNHIIRSVRGAYGGYCLDIDSHRLTAEEVLTCVEGTLAPVACLTTDTDCGIDCNACATKNTWGQMWQVILDAVGDITIGDIVERVEQISERDFL